MKYAIYDKAADAYLTTMDFDTEVPDNYTQYAIGYNEYITKARLLDTKEEAADVVTRIESFKFMDKGRFVMHSFDDTLKDQYIISETGNPTKVVESITVDLDGTINVKYGTMVSHWSAASLIYVINKLNKLQDASAPTRYCSWNATFDIYKVITVIDENGHNHYQFINVTAEGLKNAKEEAEPLNKRIEELEKSNVMLDDSVNYHNECRVALAEIIRAIKYAMCSKDSDKRANYISYMTDRIKDDEIFNRPELKTTKNDIPRICKHLTALSKDSLNKRIEELENANYELGERVTERGAVANHLLDENNSLKAKVEAIKKEARDWKKLYENADADREELKNIIDIIHSDLVSSTVCDNLKDTLKTINYTGLDHISMENFLTAKDEIRSIISHVITILESRELNQSVAFSSAEEVDRAKKLANDIIDICEATTDTFEVTLKKFSQLYEAVNDPGDDDDTIMYAFKGVLEIFSSLEDHVKSIIDESVTWKHKTQKAEKELEDQKKLNDANKATIAYLSINKIAKEIKTLRDTRGSLAEVIFAIRNAICNNDSDAFRCINSRMIHDADFNSDPFMAGARENIKDICSAGKINITNNDLKNSEIARLTEERDKALEQKEFYKRQANSVYGMTIPSRCCGKQLTADILSGKKIPISKKKYDDLVEYVNNINLTYDNMFCMMDKPVYLSTITESLNDLTK